MIANIRFLAAISFGLELAAFLIPLQYCMCGISHGFPFVVTTPSHGEYPGSIYFILDSDKRGTDFVYWNLISNFLFWFVVASMALLVWRFLSLLVRGFRDFGDFVCDLDSDLNPEANKLAMDKPDPVCSR